MSPSTVGALLGAPTSAYISFRDPLGPANGHNHGAEVVADDWWLFDYFNLYFYIFFLGPVKTPGTDPSHLSRVNFLGQVMIC